MLAALLGAPENPRSLKVFSASFSFHLYKQDSGYTFVCSGRLDSAIARGIRSMKLTLRLACCHPSLPVLVVS